MLVDCHFFNRDSGYVIGGTGKPFYDSTKTKILFTSDGGNSWTTRYEGSLLKQWLWKIYFSNKGTGYASIESWRFTDTVSYLKTINGGVTWLEFKFNIDTNLFHSQSILFLNNGTGWIGGYLCCSVTNGKTYQTIDGGLSWQPANWGNNVNRIRYVSDTLLYASGRTIYKYSRHSVGVIQISNLLPEKFSLYQNYPNPFNPVTKIRFDITRDQRRETQDVRLIIYDALGKEVVTLVNEKLSTGSYEVEFDGISFSSGIYFYKLETENFREVKRMILLK